MPSWLGYQLVTVLMETRWKARRCEEDWTVLALALPQKYVSPPIIEVCGFRIKNYILFPESDVDQSRLTQSRNVLTAYRSYMLQRKKKTRLGMQLLISKDINDPVGF